MTIRKLDRVIRAIDTSDGAGVRLRRSLGSQRGLRLDPFLMLDEFSSEDANDYIAGFPSHPHRGFETVTYMLDGHMRHEDHLGNRGDLRAGGVQWMTAGRGIIHSEMPQQQSGRMRGFQLWINLPAKEKMKPAGYRDIPAEEIPVVDAAPGVRVKVVAGALEHDGRRIEGPVNGSAAPLSTDPTYLDVELAPNARWSHRIPASLAAYAYVFEGSVRVDDRPENVLREHHGGVLGAGDVVALEAGPQGGRLLLLAGKPIAEPVVQYGPFVMNTPEEIAQAIADYQSGTLTAA
ncbi:MAG TPA: pirin family protein [Xanthomonadales bacterium]|nr:pirin family protein [Xanthomonadales bacterium]